MTADQLLSQIAGWRETLPPDEFTHLLRFTLEQLTSERVQALQTSMALGRLIEQLLDAEATAQQDMTGEDITFSAAETDALERLAQRVERGEVSR